MNEDKIKKDLEEIETINIELDHMVSKLIAENEHLKQTYKQLYDSIKPARIQSKEQCADLINQDDLRKLKGKALVDCDIKERDCKLYDEFDKFSYKKGETLCAFYLRFSLLLNALNIYNMKLEQFYVNTKFLNTLPPKWSKFVTDVKLVRDLQTTNIDQLHAYLGQ
ncbi:hypothetical protein Tco_0022567, partial [Tanacetum coccineum]